MLRTGIYVIFKLEDFGYNYSDLSSIPSILLVEVSMQFVELPSRNYSSRTSNYIITYQLIHSYSEIFTLELKGGILGYLPTTYKLPCPSRQAS